MILRTVNKKLITGNHELYNNPDRTYWLSTLNKAKPSSSSSAYYAFSPHPNFLFINLDTYDLSALGATAGTAVGDDEDEYEAEKRRLATEVYLARNPNDDKNSPLNLEGLDKRFVKFGGGVGPRQLEWLRSTLVQAERYVYIFVCFPNRHD